MRAACAIALLVWTLAAGGGASAEGLFDPAYRQIVRTDHVREFLSRSSCGPMLAPDIVAKVTDVWLPTDADIERLEQLLGLAYRRAIQNTSWIGPGSRAVLTQWESIANHERQYAGAVIDGQKVIFVFASPIYNVDFDGRHDNGWVSGLANAGAPVGACDLGPAQFSAVYDPVSESFKSFSFTGTFAGYHVP